ncbi:MAG: NAD(P)-dependent oxidoreductase [Acidobacteria bacterium]|nr:NAD(P)-dependent oxidoreductase [Acidobacteriota bacterium]
MKLPVRDVDEATARLQNEELGGRSVVVTGASGFIGRWLVETGHALGLDVFVLTRKPPIFEVPVRVIEGDYHALASRGPARCDLFIHGATATSDELAKDPKLVQETIDGTRIALDYAARAGVQRFLYLSSGAVYGKQQARVSEDAEVQPHTPYAETKIASEELCRDRVIARLFAFIGPHLPLDRNFAAGNFLHNALERKPIEVKGDGTALRSFLYAGDLAVWLWTLLVRGAAGRPYNVGSETAVSIAELAQGAAQLTDPPLDVAIRGIANPGVAPEWYVPSTQRARQELGLAEWTDWREALRRTYEWHRGES